MLILSHSADGRWFRLAAAALTGQEACPTMTLPIVETQVAQERVLEDPRRPGGPAQAWRPAPLATMALRCTRHELLSGEPSRLSRRAEDVPAHSQHQHAFRAQARYPRSEEHTSELQSPMQL